VNSLILESIFLQISFTFTRNNSGPKRLPRGTTEVNLTSLNSCSPTLTLCVQPTRKSLTQSTTLQSTPEAASFVSSRSWRTQSKALQNSIMIASIPTPSSKQYAAPWHNVMTWHSQQYPCLNPCSPSYNQSFLSQTCLKYPAITCSICLQTTEVKLMCL